MRRRLSSARTPGTGLYANLEKYSIPYPEAIFNIDYFSNDPQPFFSLAKALYPGSHRPNYIHYFIRTLHLKGLLLRMYTQNIDGLEKRESSAPANFYFLIFFLDAIWSGADVFMNPPEQRLFPPKETLLQLAADYIKSDLT